MQPDMTKLYEALASKPSNTAFEIQHVRKIAPGLFKVMASTASNMSEDQLGLAVAASLDRRVQIVHGTHVSSNRMATAVFRANLRTKPFDESKHVQVTASTARDEQGQLWSVKNIQGVKHVVAESSDDLDEIFATRVAQRKVHASALDISTMMDTASVRNGDLVAFVDTASKKLQLGIAAYSPLGLQALSSKGSVGIVENAIIRSLPKGQLDEQLRRATANIPATAALDPEDSNKILAYLRQAFGTGSDEMMERYANLMGVPLPSPAATF